MGSSWRIVANMKQRTLAMGNGFERYSKKTRRAEFLEEMEQVVPWRKLCALIEPHYPKAGNGRPHGGCIWFVVPGRRIQSLAIP